MQSKYPNVQAAHIYIYIRIHTDHTYMYMRMHVCMCIYIYIYIYAYIMLCSHICIQINVDVPVYIHACVHTYYHEPMALYSVSQAFLDILDVEYGWLSCCNVSLGLHVAHFLIRSPPECTVGCVYIVPRVHLDSHCGLLGHQKQSCNIVAQSLQKTASKPIMVHTVGIQGGTASELGTVRANQAAQQGLLGAVGERHPGPKEQPTRAGMRGQRSVRYGSFQKKGV